MSTLYRELLWIAKKAQIRTGWAYYRYKEITGKAPNEKGNPIRPSESLICDVQAHMNKFAYSKLAKAYADSLLTSDQKKIKSRAWRELDANRPRLEDL